MKIVELLFGRRLSNREPGEQKIGWIAGVAARAAAGSGRQDRCDYARPIGVAILIPELVLRHWRQHTLHSRRARRLRAALTEHAGPRLMVVTSSWPASQGAIFEIFRWPRPAPAPRRRLTARRPTD